MQLASPLSVLDRSCSAIRRCVHATPSVADPFAEGHTDSERWHIFPMKITLRRSNACRMNGPGPNDLRDSKPRLRQHTAPGTRTSTNRFALACGASRNRIPSGAHDGPPGSAGTMTMGLLIVLPQSGSSCHQEILATRIVGPRRHHLRHCDIIIASRRWHSMLASTRQARAVSRRGENFATQHGYSHWSLCKLRAERHGFCDGIGAEQ